MVHLCFAVLPNERRALQVQHGLLFYPVGAADGGPGANPRLQVHLLVYLSFHVTAKNMYVMTLVFFFFFSFFNTGHSICPMLAQFLAGGSIYILLLLLTLGEEFKHCPAPLQSLCCWVHETKCARTILTLTAISINFGVASSDIVSRFSSKTYWGKIKGFFFLHHRLSSILLPFPPSSCGVTPQRLTSTGVTPPPLGPP